MPPPNYYPQPLLPNFSSTVTIQQNQLNINTYNQTEIIQPNSNNNGNNNCNNNYYIAPPVSGNPLSNSGNINQDLRNSNSNVISQPQVVNINQSVHCHPMSRKLL